MPYRPENFPPLTDTQLRATPVPVSTGLILPASLDADGGLKTHVQNVLDIADRSGRLVGHVTVDNASIPVTGTFWQATQPVSGTVAISNPTANPETGLAKDATLTGGTQKTKLIDTAGTNVASVSAAGALKTDGSAVTQPVSGTFWQATQPVSGTFWQATQPVSLATNTPTLQAMAAASSSPTGVVSLGNSLGKTVVMKTGTLASSAVTADQVVLTYTVTTGKTFYLQYFDVACRLTTFLTTATWFGTISLENPSGTKLWTMDLAGPGVVNTPVWHDIGEPIPIASATVIRVVCTPSATTAFTWRANFGGYEK